MAGAATRFATVTSYGSWLPGDARGYVQRGEVLPGNPELERHAFGKLAQPIVLFGPHDQDELMAGLLAACDEFGYRLFELSIESWHLHWILRHDDASRVDGRTAEESDAATVETRPHLGRRLLAARTEHRRGAVCRAGVHPAARGMPDDWGTVAPQPRGLNTHRAATKESPGEARG
jgi:hypothetical protein